MKSIAAHPDTTYRILNLLSYLDTCPGSGATEVAEAIGISRTSFYRLIAAASESFGVHITNANGQYSVKLWGVLDRKRVLKRHSP
jgi:DNA-binding IclR family transcriptional regulator